MKARKKIDIVATADVSGSSLFGLYDTLKAAGRDWDILVHGAAVAPLFDVRIVGPGPEPFACGSGPLIAADLTYDEAGDADIVIVPGLVLSPVDRIDPAEHPALPWLEAQHRRGARLVSACVGAVYLAELGLLDRVEATTHWAFTPLFRQHYPEVRLRLDRGLCFHDARAGVVTSGGTTGWQELALFLIAHYGSAQIAAQTAKIWLMADRGELQAPFASMVKQVPHADAAVVAAQSWIARNYASSNPVAGMVAAAGLPATSFGRRFRDATGQSPMDYVHTLRIEEARQMLETTDASVAAVGEEAGYTDTPSFRRLFKRSTGLTPAEHRRMFGKPRFKRYVGA